MKSFIILAVLISIASAHFRVEFPAWRGDSLVEPADQRSYPCANIDSGSGDSKSKRTLWPLEGGAVALTLQHRWSYYAINLGLGKNVTNFYIPLTPELHNVTGTGTLFIPKLNVPTDLVDEGTEASLQFVAFGKSGSAYYNCADITFSSKAVDPREDEYMTDDSVSDVVVKASHTKSELANYEVDEDDYGNNTALALKFLATGPLGNNAESSFGSSSFAIACALAGLAIALA